MQDPGNIPYFCGDLIRRSLELLRICSEDFDGQLALDAAYRLVNVVFNVLTEIDVDPRDAIELFFHLRAQSDPIVRGLPFFRWTQRSGYFGGIKAVDVRTVVRSSKLTNNVRYLGVGCDNLASLPR